MLAASAAHADQRCRQVTFNVTNETGQTITVYRVEYEDVEDDKLRRNNVRNTEILNGQSEPIEETLEYVGNEPIGTVSFQYQIGSTGREWSDAEESNVERCVRRMEINHTIR